MKKKVLLTVTLILCLLLTACGGNSKESKPKKPEKKEYIEETQISELFTNPNKFKGKYVKLSGKIFTAPEKDGENIALQAWHNPDSAENNFIVYYSSQDETFSTDDYIMVDGKIEGTLEGENAFGGKVELPLISAENIDVLSYMEAIVPTIKEIVPANAICEQNGISLKVDKIEFAEKETRVYLTESNASSDKFSMFTYSMKLIQNGQQIEQDTMSSSSYEGKYPDLASEILPNASSSGIIVFPVLDSSANFQLYVEGYSDNYELEFAPFTIDVSVQQ